MLGRERLVQMARKWRKAALLGRKRISWDKAPEGTECGTLVTEKGHFVLYTCEGKRFMVPIGFLNTSILQELLMIAKEEFGFPGDGPITLPCNAVVFEHVLSLIKTGGLKRAEKNPAVSSFMRNCSESSYLGAGQRQQLVVF